MLAAAESGVMTLATAVLASDREVLFKACLLVPFCFLPCIYMWKDDTWKLKSNVWIDAMVSHTSSRVSEHENKAVIVGAFSH